MKSLSKLSLWICVINLTMSQICLVELFRLTQISRSHGILLKWLEFACVLQSNNKYERLPGMTRMWATMVVYLKAGETVYGLSLCGELNKRREWMCPTSATSNQPPCVLDRALIWKNRKLSGAISLWTSTVALTLPLCCRANVRYNISQVDYISGYK